MTVLTINLNEEAHQIRELQKEMQLQYDLIQSTLSDTCNNHDCTQCGEASDCMWVMDSSKLNFDAQPAQIGSNQPDFVSSTAKACRTVGPSLYGGETRLNFEPDVSPKLTCTTPFDDHDNFNTEQCHDAARQRQNSYCGIENCTGGEFCCVESGRSLKDGPNDMGVCVSQVSYCAFDAAAGVCQVSNPFGR